jgi:hypothetical protein
MEKRLEENNEKTFIAGYVVLGLFIVGTANAG